MRMRDKSTLAGQTVTIKESAAQIGGQPFVVEDWCQNVLGGSWMNATGNPSALIYAARTAGSTPIDDEVLYGKINGLGFLVHMDEIDRASATVAAGN
jgi:hypothetical protein